MSFSEYAAAMLGCYAALPFEERVRLHEWEAEHLNKFENLGTSDWPGWERYIGKFEPISRKDKRAYGYVYLIQSAMGHCKIGSSRSVWNRLKQLQCANPESLELLHHFPSERMLKDELTLHAQFADKRIRNEWFALTEEDIAYICKIARL